MKPIYFATLFILFFLLSAFGDWANHELPPFVTCDSDSDCYLIQAGPLRFPTPALIYLSCTGGKPWDVDSVRTIYNSLGWSIATCGKSRNHRSAGENEMDILNLLFKIRAMKAVDEKRIFLFGFSGQGAQALGTVLRYPEFIRGAITECAHLGNVTVFDPIGSANQVFFITTREEDWNRPHNEAFHRALTENRIADTLVVNPGEHGIGPAEGVFRACKWIDGKTEWNGWFSRNLDR